VEIFRHSLLFLVAVAMLAYAPGRLALRTLGRRLHPTEEATLSLVLGLILSGCVYWLLGFIGAARYFPCWPPLATAILAWVLWTDRKGPEPARKGRFFRAPSGWDRSHAALAVVLLLGAAVLAALPQYYANLTWRPDGCMRAYPVEDVFFHLAIANELTHSIPPQAPMFAGYPLSYHAGADLMVAMFSNPTGIDTRDLALRFVPTLFLALSMLSVFCFSRSWLRSGLFAALATFLVFFGEDFSFIPGLLLRSPLNWSADFFEVPSVLSLFYHNGILPGVGLLFAGLFCLQGYLRERRIPWLLFSAVIFASLVDVKFFTAVQLACSLGLAAVVSAVCCRDGRLMRAAGATALLMAPPLLAVIVRNRQGASEEILLRPFPYLQVAMSAMMPQVHLGTGAGFLGVALPLFLLGSLGLRVIGIGSMVGALGHPSGEHGMRFLLAVFVVGGIAVALTCQVVPRDVVAPYNNSVWFFAAAKYVFWLFAVEVLQRWYRRATEKGWNQAAMKLAFVIPSLGLSVPSSLQNFRYFINVQHSASSTSFSRTEVGAARFLAREASPGDVVLCGADMFEPVVSLTQCRVPVAPYADYLVPEAAYRERLEEQQIFWEDWKAGIARVDILARLNVRYLVAPRGVPTRPGLFPASLILIYLNPDFAVLRVRQPVRPTLPSGR